MLNQPTSSPMMTRMLGGLCCCCCCGCCCCGGRGCGCGGCCAAAGVLAIVIAAMDASRPSQMVLLMLCSSCLGFASLMAHLPSGGPACIKLPVSRPLLSARILDSSHQGFTG